MREAPSTNLHGLDLNVLQSWLSAHAPSLAGASLSARPLVGGKSNLTYEVVVDGHAFVLRRAPAGEVLATAHDMAREYRVMSALADTDVPVPRMLAECGDASVLGAPFYLMERVPGDAYFRRSELADLGPERTQAISERLVDTLVRLHAVDPAGVGLDDFGRPEGFLDRQVRRWRQQFDASHTRELRGLDALHAQLTDRIPSDGHTGIVHGDFRLDNVLVDRDEPTAIIDWELSTIGDPLTDLALMVVYQRLGHVAGSSTVADASDAPGFLNEDEILGRYANGAGTQLRGFGFYLALASFKLAGIAEGVYCRHLNGQTVGDGFEHLSDIPEILIASGIRSLEEHP